MIDGRPKQFFHPELILQKSAHRSFDQRKNTGVALSKTVREHLWSLLTFYCTFLCRTCSIRFAMILKVRSFWPLAKKAHWMLVCQSHACNNILFRWKKSTTQNCTKYCSCDPISQWVNIFSKIHSQRCKSHVMFVTEYQEKMPKLGWTHSFN